jgi:TatD DNase family protein
MKALPSLDAHAHLDPRQTSEGLASSGAVLAMTLSLDEAALVVDRREPQVTWGVGCHPRKLRSQEAFDAERFRKLAERTAIVGEIGLDTGSRVPIDIQLRTFRQALAIVADLPRLVSIHSYHATGLVIKELQRNPIAVPVLHWWTGTVERHGRQWRWDATSLYTQPSHDTQSFAQRFLRNVCSSRATMATLIHLPPFHVESSGWST